MKTIKGRNQYVDILRGIAMLLVVLGHTMTGSTKDSENSVLFNIVWSLQMPLFILISGYVSRYSRSLITASTFLNYVKRRTISYILPWTVWSFVIRGFIFKQKSFLNVKWLLWHMDSGYWFLITIWTISIIFGVSLFFSEKIFKNEKLKQLSVCVFYFMGMGVLILIGKFMGMNFFAIKLTLYYMPFYFVGYLYGQYYDKLSSLKNFKLIYDVVVTVCFAIWIYAVFNFNLYSMADTGYKIILRAGISVAGCVSVSGLLKGFLNVPYTSKIMWGIERIGTNSMAIYLVHYLLLNLIKLQDVPQFMMPMGKITILLNFMVTASLSLIITEILLKNRIMSIFFYGKK